MGLTALHLFVSLTPLPPLGYLGGSIIERLLDHQNAHSYTIKALVRSQEKALKLNSFGVETTVGSLEDSDLVSKLVLESDVVFSCVRVTFVSTVTPRLMLNVVPGGFR